MKNNDYLIVFMREDIKALSFVSILSGTLQTIELS